MKKEKIKYKTSFLIQKNNFFVGFGSVLNIEGSYFDYNYSSSAKEADFKSISSDWSNIGDDIKESIKKSSVTILAKD